MANTTAELVDRILPEVPVRQWVLTLPIPLRFQLAFDPELTTRVLREHIRAVKNHYRRRARRLGLEAIETGAVTVIHRFGGALNLNVHFHTLYLDGVYTLDGTGGLQFHPIPVSKRDVAEVAMDVASRVGRLLEARDPFTRPDVSPALEACAEATVLGRGVSHVGKPSRSSRHRARRSRRGTGLVGEAGGFNVHASRRVAADDRVGLERLCRYILRPPIAEERLRVLETDTEGRIAAVAYDMKRAWSNGTRTLRLTPMALLARLAMWVPAPYQNMVRYHGVLAPNAGLRVAIVARSGRVSSEGIARQNTSSRRPWAELIQRAFGFDPLTCPDCGGRFELMGVIRDRAIAKKILDHVKARGPPTRATNTSPGVRAAQG
jgi:hypothetical protein